VTRETQFRDDNGRTLADYPRPSVAVDTALMTVTPWADGESAQLGILLVRRPPRSDGARSGWALPGTFLHEGETLADAVRRSLDEKAGVTGREPQQLHVFDDPQRDDRGWVLSVAHLDVLAFAKLEALRDPANTRVVPVPTRLRLPYDHLAIIELAIGRLRAEYRAHPDPRGLLRDSFTIADLRAVHESVAGCSLQKDTFRRLMIDELESLPAAAEGRRGRPAQLFARRGQ
jgi:ADP-ribose pyrophosphatase YjhB (NUDIX family)